MERSDNVRAGVHGESRPSTPAHRKRLPFCEQAVKRSGRAACRRSGTRNAMHPHLPGDPRPVIQPADHVCERTYSRPRTLAAAALGAPWLTWDLGAPASARAAACPGRWRPVQVAACGAERETRATRGAVPVATVRGAWHAPSSLRAVVRVERGSRQSRTATPLTVGRKNGPVAFVWWVAGRGWARRVGRTG